MILYVCAITIPFPKKSLPQTLQGLAIPPPPGCTSKACQNSFESPNSLYPNDGSKETPKYTKQNHVTKKKAVSEIVVVLRGKEGKA